MRILRVGLDDPVKLPVSDKVDADDPVKFSFSEKIDADDPAKFIFSRVKVSVSSWWLVISMRSRSGRWAGRC